jgi:transcription antitermination protein NusB
MGYRRRARECALQLLYQYDLTHDGLPEILARYWEMQEPQPQQTREKAAAYFQAALQRRDEIDHLIREHSHNWQLERMSVVDRNILRLAICEMLMSQEAQVPVIINEALEIAKRFSSEDTSPFINGVLDSIHHALKSSPPAAGEPVTTSKRKKRGTQ